MLKIILGAIALCILVDAMAFGGYYRDHMFHQSMALTHRVFQMEWRLSN